MKTDIDGTHLAKHLGSTTAKLEDRAVARSPYPWLGINGEYFSKDFLEGVEEELSRLAPMWSMGMDTPTECEKFAYHVLKQIKLDNVWGKKGV